MPYASSIQIVNDANGTAYAFLADNGAIWQCQWNAQAQRWDQGQMVPGAQGGEKLQALYLSDLWPTESGGSSGNATTGNNPGIVVAYRVGEGSGAEIYASLGQWGNDGQLSWSVPVQLTDDQVEDQDFSLMEGTSGGFSLVVQKQQAATPANALLDKLANTPSDRLEAELKVAASGERPDSDLYATQFAIAADTSGGLQLHDLTAGTDQSLTAARPPASTASSELAFSGNTQLSRQQLITQPAEQPQQSLSAGPMLALQSSEPTSSVGWRYQGGAGAQFNGRNGGSFRVGFLAGTKTLRWQLTHHGASEHGIGDEGSDFDALTSGSMYSSRPSILESAVSLDEDSADYDGLDHFFELLNQSQSGAERITNPGPSVIGSAGDGEGDVLVRLLSGNLGRALELNAPILGWSSTGKNPAHTGRGWTGVIGVGNAGRGGPTVFSTAKYAGEAGNNSRQGILAETSSMGKRGEDGGFLGFSKVRSGNSFAFGGSLRTVYQYQGKGRPNLVSLQSDESVAADWNRTSLRLSDGGGSLSFVSAVSLGWQFDQYLASPTGGMLPQWLADVGYAGGLAADAEKTLISGKVLGQAAFGARLYPTRYSDPKIFQAAREGNGFNTLSGGLEGSKSGLGWVNAGVGTALAALGPATSITSAVLGGLGADAELTHGSGIDLFTRLTGRYLYKSVLGLQFTVANEFSYNFFGTEAGTGSDEFYTSFGLALPLGASVPLFSYSFSKELGQDVSQQSLSDAPQALSAKSSGGIRTSTTPASTTSKGGFISASGGETYPFLYAPQSGSNSYFSAATSTAQYSLALLGGQATTLQLFTLNPTAQGAINPSEGAGTALLTLINAGSGLIDGNYPSVPILGITADGDPQTAATASFTVVNGSIQASSFQIISGGSYVGLPETQSGNGIYALVLDVYSTGAATKPDPGSSTPNSLLSDLPLITLDASQANSVMEITTIQRVSSVPVNPTEQLPSLIYPQYDPTNETTTAPSATQNASYTYNNVPVQLFVATATPLPLLNPAASGATPANSVSATVTLSGGVIQRVELDQPLLVAESAIDASAFKGWIMGTTLTVTSSDVTLAAGDLILGKGVAEGTRVTASLGNSTYSLGRSQTLGSAKSPVTLSTPPTVQLTLPDAVVSSLPQGSPPPSFPVLPEALGLNNVVADEQFSAQPGQPGQPNAGVYLAAGMSDELPLSGAMASWPVQNRVTYVSTTNTGTSANPVLKTNLVYLNGQTRNATGPNTAKASVLPSDLSLQSLYGAKKDANPIFSAASTPTAISIKGLAGSPYANATFVAWVEAADPVIPSAVNQDGSQNFQGFMEALYGHQRINYRINKFGSTGWVSPSLNDLYEPDNAVIRHLQAFNVVKDGEWRTLVVWDEASIDAIKDSGFEGWIQGATLNIASSDVSLSVGDLIVGVGVAEGTRISADNGDGTYILSHLQSLGSQLSPVVLRGIEPVPTVIKAGWINANPANNNYQWNNLFADANGNSTIQTIPWDQNADVGLTIDDISIASQALLQADGSIAESPLITWSQEVRTPYRQSVLNDQPNLYLQFGQLQSGISDINIGSVNSNYTDTYASETGLNFALAGALPKSQATAVQNIHGIGVLSTGLGSMFGSIRQIASNIPAASLAAGSAIARFTGAISGDTLTVSALTAGRLEKGDLLAGPGVLAGTTITSIEAADQATGLGTYTISQGQSLAATDLQAIETSSQFSLSSFDGSISGNTLTISGFSQGNLAVGDLITGPGIPPGTTIINVNDFDLNSGIGSVQLDRSFSSPLASSALVASPGVPSSPYTIEFWAQLSDSTSDKNPNGAGLVALGQPSDAAVGVPELPEGWLLNASFVVDRITNQQASAQGLPDVPVDGAATDLYGWQWGVLATGANTTAMDGNGGSNLYNNALLLNNLVSGSTLAGVNQFLANYGLTPDDLSGIDQSDAATIVSVPTTQLEFSNAIDSSTGLPNSSLNAIAVDTSTALLNQGLVEESSGISSELSAMFTALWDFQQATGEAKVNFSLAPDSPNSTTTGLGSLPSGLSTESYSGYQLGFALARGTAISVNGSGQLVFDVGDGTSITSQASGTVPADLRDGTWHYVVASFLPTYQTYDAGGVATQLPTNMGTASLYVDNQLVASDANVFNPYPLINLNDQAQLLANNAQGAIDQLAIYDKALSSAAFNPNLSGNWPTPNAQDALALLSTLGYDIATKTPHPGAIPGAVSKHWEARNVNPNAAALATYTSSFDASTNSWSQASSLNPLLQVDPSLPSYSSGGSLQDGLVIAVPTASWSSSHWNETTGSSTKTDGFFNPANQVLTGVTVILTNLTDTTQAPVTISLTPDQVLIGSQSLEMLQPLASKADFNYKVLSNTPAFSLVIPKDQLPADNDDRLEGQYNATYSFSFGDGASTVTTVATTTVVNSAASSLAAMQATGHVSSASLSRLQDHNKAIATAQVIEEAPLQLKYVDSGVVLKSAETAAGASNPADFSPANSFGQSQVFGSFTDSNSNTNGWLAIAQPFSTNALTDPAGRVWVQYTGQSKSGTPSSTVAQAPNTWLNALANSNFSPDTPNLPLLGDANNPSSSGGLLIKADPTTGWGQNFGQTMLVADVNQDGISDLIIAAPQANGGGRVVIVDGQWIKTTLTSTGGATTLDLSNPSGLGSYVTVLTPAASGTDVISVANFGSALAFDGTTLWIGAPNYLSQLGPSGSKSLQTLVPIGALYRYGSSAANPNGWGAGVAQALSNPILGSSGTTVTTSANGTETTAYWGSQFGTAIAVNGSGGIAISAPGVQASLLYSGTKAVQQSANGKKNPSDPYGDGALVKIQLPSSGNHYSISTTQGVNNSGLIDVGSQSGSLSSKESTYMQNLKALQVDSIVEATYANNQAIQAGEVGAVYLFGSSADLTALTTAVTPEAVAAASNGGATFYGALPWNTLGASGFGSSLSFADFNNTNSSSILAIGAPQTGGSGALYLVDTSQGFTKATSSQPSWIKSINLAQGHQYLAHLASGLTLYGAGTADQFANGLLNLGDVNHDTYQDLLIQAYNASSGAGNGYVLFGNDQIFPSSGSAAPNPASGSVGAGSIGQLKRADGTSLNTAILSELGYGTIGYTGQGTFGSGDINGDGISDIPLGSGPNGNAYLTWGHPYLEAIENLQLSRLTSDSGFMLDGLAAANQGSLRSIGDFNGDGYGDFISISSGNALTNVRIELGANTQEMLADAPYNFYNFTVANGTQVLPGGDVNGDGMDDIVLFLDQNLTSATDGNGGAGSTSGILFGRSSIDLPLGAGFGFIAPVDPTTSAPGSPLPGLPVEKSAGEVGLTDATASVIAVGNTLYAAVKGYGDNTLWFTQSRDGGNSWENWTELGAVNGGFATSAGPSLAFFENKLYLGFLNLSGTLSLSSWDPATNNLSAWSAPAALSDSSDPTAAFRSAHSPQLLNRGDSLGVVWVDSGSGTLQSASSTMPGTGPMPSPWAVVDGGASLASPAVARAGNTIYMAVQCGPNNSSNAIYWTSSSNGGSSWADWQALPSSMTSTNAPSLAVVNGTLYLSYLGVGNNDIFITSLSDAATNKWASAYQVPGQSATYASLISETVGGESQLAVYYVSNDSTDRILKSYTTSPASSSNWTTDEQIQYNSSSGSNQTASGPLALSQYNGQTYIAYQGGTIGSSSDEIYIATSSSSNLNDGVNWSAQSLLNPSTRTGLGLSSTADGLLLSYGNSTATDALQLLPLTPASSGLTLNVGTTQALSLPTGLSNNITILSGEADGVSNLLLAGINTSANSNSVQTSLIYDAEADSSWSSPTTVLQRLEDNGVASFVPISATAAPTATWLGEVPVLAVNDNGSINVYAGAQSGSSLELTSSFSAPSAGPAISSAPVLTSTPTGLALTYTNADGSINLNRLSFVTDSGTPLPGVQFNSDGSLNTSNADLQWQSITLNESNSGLSTSLASTPVSVNGNLLLTNMRNIATQDNQIWINAVPNLSDEASITWLNSSVQLPNGSGGWSFQQKSGTVNIGTFTPHWNDDAGGLSPSAPSFAELNGVLYAAVVGYSNGTDNGLMYWNSSSDGGRTWGSWQQVPNYASDQAPSLAAYQGNIYMAYVGTNSGVYIAELTDPGTNTWSQAQAGNQTCQYIGLTSENGTLAAYYVGSNNELYRTATTTPSNGNSWSNSTVIQYSGGDQTASGNLAVTTVSGSSGDTTYLAYQGGTPSSPSDTLYLTYSSTQSNGNSSSWSEASISAQPSTPNRGGVTLSHNHAGLLLGYPDKVNGEVVYVVQQSTNSGSTWTPFTTLAPPTGTMLPSSGGYSSFNLLASANSNDVLVGAINNGSGDSDAIYTAIVSELPPSTSLTSSQSQSNISAVGDLNGDGFDDLLVVANNVVVNPSSSSPTLATGLRLISGAATSAKLHAANQASDSSQNVQLAPWRGLNTTTPVASLSGSGQLSVTTTDPVSGLSLSSSAAFSASSAFTATAGNLATAQSLFKPSAGVTLGNPPAGPRLGDLGLISTGGFGDLDGNGFVDHLDPTSATVVTGAYNQTWNLWSIRAAGDVNGNGVDDVLLSLAPQGPAYTETSSGQPSALQSVLVDGFLFKVDSKTNSFRLDQLKAPLNPYNNSQLFDVGSTSTSDYAPSLQNWFEPILGFAPGSLSAASIGSALNPGSADSYTPPCPVVSPEGDTYLFFSGADTSGTNKASGLWMAYLDDSGTWQQQSLADTGNGSVGSSCSDSTPSAAYFDGQLYIAYADVNQAIRIAVCSGSPQDLSNWTEYAVVTTVNETTYSSPTLIAEAGRLAIYFPSDNSGGQSAQTVRYLYSNNPGSSTPSWGGSFASSAGGKGLYSGISQQLKVNGSTQAVTSPIAATTFHGRTILAYRGYNSSFSNGVSNGTVHIATQGYAETDGSNPGVSRGWTITDTAQSNVNGVGLTTDQALLYLTTSGSWDSLSPSSTVWSLSPGSSAGTWTTPPKRANLATSPSLANLSQYGVINPFFLDGKLMATWTAIGDAVQIADLNLTIGSSSQQSLAGYSLDGNIDIDGDGFKDVLISDPSDPAESVDNQYALFGGDFLNIASQVGTPGDDALVGTPLADVIYSVGGSDRVISAGGKDVIYTGSGDDQISIVDPNFIRIDAGSGVDTLQLQGQVNQSYDFQLAVDPPQYFAGTKLRDIELISSMDYGANVLSFDVAAVNAINADRILFLTPDASDTITLSGFVRNPDLDTSYGGVLWSAYSAGLLLATADANPSLVYVLNPDGAAASDWLSSNVTPAPLSASQASLQASALLRAGSARTAAALVAEPAPTEDAPVSLSQPSAIASSMEFGDGLRLIAYRSAPSSGLARFAIERSDSRRRQVIAYASNSADSSAEPGRDYTAIAGLLVLEPGQLSQELTVPIVREAFAQLRGGTLSLKVEELADLRQSALHLLLAPAVSGSASAAAPVLSGFELTPNASGDGASLRLRADANGSNSDLASLQLAISQRSHGDGTDVVTTQTVSLLDAIAVSGAPVPAYDGVSGALALDHDGHHNGQISGQLELNFTATDGQPSVSLSAPTLRWQPSLQRADDLTLEFLDDVPLTCWRADSLSGVVSFGLEGDGRTYTLLSDAHGGSDGSLNPDKALDDSASGWLSTEGKAVGSRSVIEGLELAGTSWRPTARRDGQALELLDVQVDGNQITAVFAGGVTAVYGQQGTGRAPTPAPIFPSVQVQRLGRYDNALGFYAVDAVTGEVDGLAPRDDGYLEAALARSRASGLLLTPDQMPAFGSERSFEDLPLNSNQNYGILVLVDGDRDRILSSFAEANSHRQAQMINLGSTDNGLVLGFEDQVALPGQGDIDFNDLIVTIQNVTVPLF